jgi:hypothetical protein
MEYDNMGHGSHDSRDNNDVTLGQRLESQKEAEEKQHQQLNLRQRFRRALRWLMIWCIIAIAWSIFNYCQTRVRADNRHHPSHNIT